MSYIRIIAALLLVSIGIILQFLFGDLLGVWFNFTLGGLIAAAFALGFFELLWVEFIALYALQWQPVMSLEFLALAVLPIGAFLIQKLLPLEPWAGSILLTCASIFALYALFGFRIIMQNPLLFSGDLLLSTLYATAVFWIMTFFPQPKKPYAIR